MAPSKDRGRLQLDQDERFQRWEWRLQRVGWVALPLVLVAAALGLLGPPGPLAQAATESGPLRLEVHRVQRRMAPTTLRLAVAPGPDEQVTLLVGRALADALEVRSVLPEPTEHRWTTAGDLLTFRREPGHSLRVVFHATFEQTGRVAGEVGVAGQPPVQVAIFVLP